MTGDQTIKERVKRPVTRSAQQQVPDRSGGHVLELDVRDSRWACVTSDVYAFIERAVEATYQAVGEEGPFELSVVLTDDLTIQNLNREFRGKDCPTNVLSFAVRDAGGVCVPGQSEVLGDVVVSFDTMAREAEDIHKALSDHFCHILVHGVLHVLGYDHVTDKDAVQMEALETYILRTLGLTDPWGDSDS